MVFSCPFLPLPSYRQSAPGMKFFPVKGRTGNNFTPGAGFPDGVGKGWIERGIFFFLYISPAVVCHAFMSWLHVRYVIIYKTRLFIMAHVRYPRRFRLLAGSWLCRRLRCTGRVTAYAANGGTGSCTRAGAYHIRAACAPGFGCRGTFPSVRTRWEILPG